MTAARTRARIALALIALAFVLASGRTALTQSIQPAEQTQPLEFVLRAPADRIAGVASRYGLTIVRQIEGHPDVYLVRRSSTSGVFGQSLALGSTQTLTQQLTNTVLSDPDVEHFEVNGSAIITETQAAPRLDDSTVAILDALSNRATTVYFGNPVWQQYVEQPGLGLIRLPAAQQLAHGDGIIVAVIDTGVDPHHPAFRDALVPGYDFTRDLAGPGSEWADLDDSTVAILDSANGSIADQSAPVLLNDSTVAILDSATASQLDISRLPAAFGHGTMVSGLVHVVAPSARIMPLKAFKADGSANLFDIERAIYYAVDHGAKVINMSFSMADASTEITHAIDYASQRGVICLASVGNSGRKAVVYPAGFRNVLGIGSTTLLDARSTFSNFGDHLVKFAAPGELLITLYPGGRYANVSGTSFSTALAAGGAVLLSELNPTIDIRLISRFFDEGSVKHAELEIGDGRIDLLSTLAMHMAVPPPPPPPPPGDTIAPAVALTSPAEGATVSGVVSVEATASDDIAVTGVQFMIDGAPAGPDQAAAPYGLSWETGAMANGTHTVSVTAHDAAGNAQTSSATVTVSNDTTAPELTLTSPGDGATLAGLVTLSADASDTGGVAGVQFAVDGVALGAEDTTSPYAVAWDSLTVASGTHVLTATARDQHGNQQNVSITVTVANDVTAPSVMLTSPAENSTLAGLVMLEASASDDVGVVQMQFTIDGVPAGPEYAVAPYRMEFGSATLSNGPHTIGATARDAAGNTQTASMSVMVANDTTPPNVALTSPFGGSILSGMVPVEATASDDAGIAGVLFTLDGVVIGSERTSAPYAIAWDSRLVSSGTHELTAIARDGSGNSRASTMSVMVSNDVSTPNVSLTNPTDGSMVGGLVTVEALASDNVGVAGVRFTLDGVPIGSEQAIGPYLLEWDTSAIANGAHVLTATARDAAGNHQSVASTVVVENSQF